MSSLRKLPPLACDTERGLGWTELDRIGTLGFACRLLRTHPSAQERVDRPLFARRQDLQRLQLLVDRDAGCT